MDGQQTFMASPGPGQLTDAYGRERVTDRAVRCMHVKPDGSSCNKLLALIVTRPWRIQCPRCKAINQAGISLQDGSM